MPKRKAPVEKFWTVVLRTPGTTRRKTVSLWGFDALHVRAQLSACFPDRKIISIKQRALP
jgi:hypothetical protein